jgi:hypothetical protein
VISRAYVSLGRVDGTAHVKEPPVCPLATVLTVWRLPEGPFFKLMVTGPVALVQVKSID